MSTSNNDGNTAELLSSSLQQQQPPQPQSPSPAVTGSTTTTTTPSVVMVRTAEATLDRLHTAADHADFDSYFDCFATDGYFIGTDSTERWTIVPDFYNYTKPYFDQGHGWTYTPVSRHITYLNPATVPLAAVADETGSNALPPSAGTGTVALFDEILSHERFGRTRNSGVMILRKQATLTPENVFAWKIVQYHLTIPIPNQYVDTVVKIIHSTE